MADGNLVLNLDFSAPAVQAKAPKFVGGTWRDRSRAKNEFKRKQTGEERPAKRPRVEDAAAQSLQSPQRWHIKKVEDRRQPVERLRPDEEDSETRPPRPSATTSDRTGGERSGNVTSRLFTANPTALTDFTTAVDDDSAVAPSNAPLSEEAASFAELGLARRIALHLASKMNIKAPTAIQKKAVPQLLGDSDVFLQSETGSGKTLTYLLPIVQRIVALSQRNDGAKRKADGKEVKIGRTAGLFAVILAPTRELCLQISRVLEQLLGCAPWLVSTAVIGGQNRKAEKARLRKGVNILVATPGRLVDHLENTEALGFRAVRWLVLDEGDQLMDLGFEEDIKTILEKIGNQTLEPKTNDGVVLPKDALPERRVTILCSATMKMTVQKLGEISLKDAIHITPPSRAEAAAAAAAATGGGAATSNDETTDKSTNQQSMTTPLQLKQACIVVPAKLRLVTLVALLRSVFVRKGGVTKAIVFLSCTASANFHFDLLRLPSKEPPADAKSPSLAQAAYIASEANQQIELHKLHGNMEAKARADTLAAFKREKKAAVLLTTDVASRGLDVEGLDLVIEYDPAMSQEVHEHRIGRTARAGRSGKAILFLLPGSEEGYIPYLQKTSDSTISAQPYVTFLQKGFATPIDFDAIQQPSAAPNGGGANIFDEDVAGKQSSWRKQAEALQLHLEQRVLRSSTDEGLPSARSRAKDSKAHGKKAKPEPLDAEADLSLMDSAQHAFNSHMRAYATHDSRERTFFDKNALHKGHLAKSFALRMSPRAIGATAHQKQTKGKAGKAGKAKSSHSSKLAGPGAHKRPRYDDDDDADFGSDDDDMPLGHMDEDAAAKMMAGLQNLNSVNEFNIG